MRQERAQALNAHQLQQLPKCVLIMERLSKEQRPYCRVFIPDEKEGQ
jgi:hypothetical protein